MGKKVRFSSDANMNREKILEGKKEKERYRSHETKEI